MISRRHLLAAGAATLALASPAAAQTYPSKPIKLIVAVAAGGPMDTIARVIATQMQARLGQPVVVENRPGAGTTIGNKSVATADPDGYTLLWGTVAAVAIAPVLYTDPGYDPKAFTPIGLICDFPHVLVIPNSVPAKTLPEFIAYAKANYGKLNFGGSLGTPPQLMGVTFNKLADLGMTYVPYKGGAPSLPDLMTGRMSMQFDALTLLQPLIKDGKLRAIAVTTNERWPGLPEIPTMKEAGFPNFPGSPWAGILAPPKTPPALVSKLNATLNEILKSDEAKANLAKLNVLLLPGSPKDYADYMAKQVPLWMDMVKASGATAH